MLAGIGKVSLRKVEAPQEKKILKVDTTSVEDHQNLMLDANLEEWEDAIKDFTFATHYMDLTKDDAKALLLANIHRGLETGTISKDEVNDFLPGNDSSLLDFDYKNQITNLTKRLQEKMVEIEATDGVFVKTSCRSPKDAPAAGEKLKKKYINRLSGISDPTIDEKLDALLFAGVQCLKVVEATEAIELLCSSDRIRVDMFVALNPDLSREWQQNLVLRKWVDIDSDMEFRGFVKDQKFTALSQYNHQFVSKRLVENKKIFEERIFKFWENEIAPRLADHEKLKSYIVDFALTGNDLEKIWVVELNPFLTSTSPNLFSWTKDSEVLHNGPFEFRIREKSSRGVLGDMTPEWRQIIEMPLP